MDVNLTQDDLRIIQRAINDAMADQLLRLIELANNAVPGEQLDPAVAIYQKYVHDLDQVQNKLMKFWTGNADD